MGPTRNPLTLVDTGDTPADGADDEGSAEIFQELRVLDMKGRTFKLHRIKYTTTVGAFKEMVQEESDVEVRLQRLIYGGRQLSNDAQTLVEAKILDNTVLHLFQRPSNMPVATPIAAGEGGGAEPSVTTVQGVRLAEGRNQNSLSPTSSGSPALEFNVELQEHRRRVKLLATLLLMVSVLNLVTLAVYLMDALFEHLTSAQWINLGIEFFVNILGVLVAMMGVQGTSTLDDTQVQNYFYGLLCVGALYIGSDIYGLVRVISMPPKDGGDSPDSPGDDSAAADVDVNSSGEDAEDETTANRDDEIGAASTSLIVNMLIWPLCFFRAFQFRSRLRVITNGIQDG